MQTFKLTLAMIALVALTGGQGDAQRITGARVRPLPTGEWTSAHHDILGTLDRGDSTIDVFKTCLQHEALCRSWMPFTRYVLGAGNTLAARDRELLILRTSWSCKADYDWAHHVPGAKRAGLTDEEIVRITKGPDAPGWSRADAELLRAADELHRDQFITEATWHALASRYNEHQLMDVVFTVGQYTIVSMFLNSAGVQLEPGLQPMPK
jgi:alkylhydroperoxidase family enzyme